MMLSQSDIIQCVQETNPQKVTEAGRVAELFKGKEEELNAQLRNQYGKELSDI